MGSIGDLKKLTYPTSRIAEVMTQIKQQQQRLAEVTKSIGTINIPDYSHAIRQMQTYVRSIKIPEPVKYMQEHLQKLAESTKVFFEALEKSRNSDFKAFTWMIDNGWPPLIHVAINTPTKLMNYCIKNKMDRKSIRKLLDNEIVKYHNSDMIKKTISPSWDNSFISKKRMKILQSAVQAHLDKKYELSVPALLTQLDGIPNEYFNFSTNSIHQCEELFISQNSVSKDELMELIFLYLKSIIFKGIDNNDDKLMEINRHKILHGVYVNYNKESVSLKLMLIIDILITYPKFVSLPHAKVYHMPHCPHYQRASKNKKKKYRMIHTRLSASNGGLKPCKRCLKNVK
ncbi:MAG: hypothetical protein JXB29_05955 [Sedimentisphaerales bacterium]|nr:hypothetical protein [Sedimentisphaerales bacterium]